MSNVLKAILGCYPELNESQIEAICSTEGPVQIIAGPGTGKTLVLILRAFYLLLSGKAEPSEIVLTTFTEKATFELRDRIHQTALKTGFKGQLHDLKIGTIHSICRDFINKYLHRTPLRNNYIILDELTQYLFLYEHFNEIISEKCDDAYLGKWHSKWTTIQEILPYFNKITEEMVNPESLENSSNEFVALLAGSYQKYQHAMYAQNSVDFSHLQRLFYDLLFDEELYERIKGKIRYIMVDEYQDTNYIQEQIFLKLAKPDLNLCIVGDEDQALYRFRGASVRNILEFQNHFQNCKQIVLSINYRSHETIISSYNKFMNSISWMDSKGKAYRFQKEIKPNPQANFPDYPAVFCIWGNSEKDEAERLASMIDFLKRNNIIEDYSQVALLFKSVRLEHSQHYSEALARHNIPYFNPRAKAYFDNKEVKLLIACFAVIFGMYGDSLKNSTIADYIEETIRLLYQHINDEMKGYLQNKVKQIAELREGESLDMTVIDYFYQLLAYSPFSDFIADENSARNMSLFSKLLSIFQVYYSISIISFKNKDIVKSWLFDSYLRFLINGGIDEYEDPDNPIPKGHVQIMTIHQSKGLEFPVIIIGSLDKNFKVTKQVDRDLEEYYPRGSFEPHKKITEFDRMRHYYVAFSRAEKILVLTTSQKPKEWFSPIWEGLDQWPHVAQDTLKSLNFICKPQFIPKKSYSLTSHINIYETCPRQYLFYKEYEFTPSRFGGVLFGMLVHQTIEDIHRMVLEGKLTDIGHRQIEDWFEQNYQSLLSAGFRPIGESPKTAAFHQILNYFDQNQQEMHRIIDTELDVSIEKDDYIIAGKIDLLLGSDGKIELLDFKTQQKPSADSLLMNRCFKQLCLYATIVRERYGKSPDRLLLYWTAEESRKEALTEFEYSREDIESAGNHFEQVVRKIKARKYDIITSAEKKVCKECDFKHYCSACGIHA